MIRRISIELWGGALAASLGLNLGGCGGETTGTGPGTSGGTGGTGPTTSPYPCEAPSPEVDPNGDPTGIDTCADGSSHRVEPVTCTSALPRSDVSCDDGLAGGACSSDADCTDQPHGMCSQGFDGTCQCSYRCTTDADCGDGFLCQCGGVAGRCVEASCRTDDDCAGSLECRSYAIPNGICGERRFECQTADDTCSQATCGDGCVLTESGIHECQDVSCAVPGRPFLVGGLPIVAAVVPRGDWLGPTPARPDAAEGTPAERDVNEPLDDRSLDAETRQAVAEHYAKAAALEHASIAAFSRFSLELLALGAPAELVRGSIAAADDERVHAELCYRLVSRFAHEPFGPGPLDISGALGAATLLSVVEGTMREGCIGETVAALQAAEALAYAEDPEVRGALGRISEDEGRHAALAWRFLRWASERDERALSVAERVLAEERRRQPAPAPLDAPMQSPKDALVARGVLPAAHQAAIHRDALERVVAPLLRSIAEDRVRRPICAERGDRETSILQT